MKVIRLNENDIENLVKKILKEERKPGVCNDIFPRVPDKLRNLLTYKSDTFMNRIIVKIKGPNAGWYDYSKDFNSEPEWWGPTIYKNKKGEDVTEEVIFDQDVIEGSEDSKEARMFKKWLIAKGINVKKVYLGEP